MSVSAIPGFDLQPSAQRVPLKSNYITNFDFLNQYLPDTYEKEFENILTVQLQPLLMTWSLLLQ